MRGDRDTLKAVIAGYRGAKQMNPLLQRIAVDPNVCFGKPCIRGTRIWVSLILDFLANGASIEELLAQYPQLEDEDIRAALAYGAEMAGERCIEIPTEGDAHIHHEDTTSCRRTP